MKHSAAVIGAVLLSLLAAACSNQADPGKPAPSAAEAKTAELEPAAPQNSASGQATAKPVEAATPATFEQALQAIDMRKLPKLEGAQVQLNKAAWLNYTAPGQMADVAEFYRKKLTELGWIEDPTPFPGLDPSKYIFARFDKAGFHVDLSVSKTYQKEGMIDVNMINYGNVDPRQLPRLADAKPTFFHRHYVSYTTAAKPKEAVEFCRKELAARGWREFRVSLAKFHAKEGRFLLGFANNGMGLFVNISTDKDGQTAVETRVEVRDKPVRIATKDLPKPATLREGQKVIDLNRFPRLEGAAAGHGSSALLQYDAPGTTADALAFYRKKLAEQGWTEEYIPRDNDSILTPRFTKAGFLLELFIAKSEKGNRVNIRVENKGNVDARQLPRAVADEAEGHDTFDDVHYDIETSVQAGADFFRKELPKQGWKEDKSSSRDYVDGSKSLSFSQKAITLKIEVRPGQDGETTVRVQPELYGVFIPRPGKPEEALAVIDLRKFPTIDGVRATNVTSGGVDYAASGSVADAVRFYRQEFAKKGWREQRPTPLETDDRARLRFGKEAFIVEVSILANEGRGVGIGVHNRGDLNTRELLHLEDAKLNPDSVKEATRYTTAATTDTAVDFYRKELPKFGWELAKGPETIPSHIELVFVQKPMKLIIQITTNAEKKTQVLLQSWVVGES